MRSPGDARIGSFISRSVCCIWTRGICAAVRLKTAKRCCVRLDYVRCARLVYVDHIVGRGADLFELRAGSVP